MFEIRAAFTVHGNQKQERLVWNGCHDIWSFLWMTFLSNLIIMPPPLGYRALSDDAHLTSDDVCLSH